MGATPAPVAPMPGSRSRTAGPPLKAAPAPPPTDKALPMHRITLHGLTVSYVLKRSQTARYLRIEVRPGTGLTVVMPRRGTLEAAQRFLLKKSRWILDKLAKFAPVEGCPPAFALKDGDTVRYLGRAVKVVSRQSRAGTSSGVPAVTMKGKTLRVCSGQGTAGLGVAVEGWYRTEAERVIRGKAATLVARLGVNYRGITLRAQKTRWSCSRQGNLSFNWRLLMAPERVIDYVIIHELAHLKQMNHSKAFWAIVEDHCPGWQRHRKWLREHESELARMMPG